MLALSAMTELDSDRNEQKQDQQVRAFSQVDIPPPRAK